MQALTLVVAVERVRRSRRDDRRGIAEHPNDLVPEWRGSELEAVVVGCPPYEHEVRIDARQNRREQEAIALFLPGPITGEPCGRQRAPQLGRARGLGGLATREYAVLETAEHERRRRRESREADADDAHAPSWQAVAQAHLDRIERGQHVLPVDSWHCLRQLVGSRGGRGQGTACRHARARLRRRRRTAVRAGESSVGHGAQACGRITRIAQRRELGHESRRLCCQQLALRPAEIGDAARTQARLGVMRARCVPARAHEPQPGEEIVAIAVRPGRAAERAQRMTGGEARQPLARVEGHLHARSFQRDGQWLAVVSVRRRHQDVVGAQAEPQQAAHLRRDDRGLTVRPRGLDQADGTVGRRR